MFTRSSKVDKKKADTPITICREVSGAPSIISVGVHIMGDLDSPGELQLDGIIHGNVRCSALILGESGEVEGQIVADSITIRGRVEGELTGNTIRLEKSANVIGNILHQTISIEAGARIRGKLIHMDDSQHPCALKSVSESECADNAQYATRKLEPSSH